MHTPGTNLHIFLYKGGYQDYYFEWGRGEGSGFHYRVATHENGKLFHFRDLKMHFNSPTLYYRSSQLLLITFVKDETFLSFITE